MDVPAPIGNIVEGGEATCRQTLRRGGSDAGCLNRSGYATQLLLPVSIDGHSFEVLKYGIEILAGHVIQGSCPEG